MKVTEKVVNHSQKQMKNPDSRLIVLGSPCVGKSALVVRFLTKRFIWEYDPTLECAYRHQTTVDEELVTLEILDTAGMNDSLNREGQVRWGDGFLLVYNITDRRSFEEIIQLRQYIESVRRTKNLSCVIVGNKIDLDHERQVKYSEGEKLALEMACAFFECSACDGGDNITEAFYELHREIRRRKMIEGKSRRRSSAQQVIQAFNKMFTKING